MHKSDHKKHESLSRPAYGEFHRQEWAIIGTPCGNIRQLAFETIGRLAGAYRLAYVDADHPGADAGEANGRDPDRAMAHGAHMEYIDKITYHRLDLEGKRGKFQHRRDFNEADAVLVNGNHFQASRQIVVIDPKKEASLKKKLDQLTDVRLLLLAGGVDDIYPFLRDHLSGKDSVPVMKLSDRARIAEWMQEQLTGSRPPLYGLVLAGGRSERMGRDKGEIDYHGKPQREYALELLNAFCEKTFLSLRPGQEGIPRPDMPVLTDTFTGLGPFGAILSAFRQHPDAAWLVIATDLPLLDRTTLAQLAAKRQTSKVATAFNSPVDGFPEPLIAIWEPRSYPVLLQFLAQGYSCPRKALINSDVELIDAANPDALMNVNYPEELDQALARLRVL